MPALLLLLWCWYINMGCFETARAVGCFRAELCLHIPPVNSREVSLSLPGYLLRASADGLWLSGCLAVSQVVQMILSGRQVPSLGRMLAVELSSSSSRIPNLSNKIPAKLLIYHVLVEPSLGNASHSSLSIFFRRQPSSLEPAGFARCMIYRVFSAPPPPPADLVCRYWRATLLMSCRPEPRLARLTTTATAPADQSPVPGTGPPLTLTLTPQSVPSVAGGRPAGLAVALLS